MKHPGIYPPLFTDPEGDSCFSIHQIRCIKKRFFNFFSLNFFAKGHAIFLSAMPNRNSFLLVDTGGNVLCGDGRMVALVVDVLLGSIWFGKQLVGALMKVKCDV